MIPLSIRHSVDILALYLDIEEETLADIFVEQMKRGLNLIKKKEKNQNEEEHHKSISQLNFY